MYTTTYNGKEISLYQLSKETGIAYTTLFKRLKKGYPLLTGANPWPKSTHTLTYKGEEITVSDLAKKIGMQYTTVRRRIDNGWTADEIVKKRWAKR